MRSGEVLHIPSNVWHKAEALEDTLDMDVFSPPREDWLNHTDTYLQAAPRRVVSRLLGAVCGGSFGPAPRARMDLGLKGKVALVGGSSRGLGRAVARELAAEGCAVVLCSRDPDAIARAGAEIAQQTGAETIAVAANLSDAGGAAHVVSTAMSRFGQVDVLVTNTGGPPAGSFESQSPEAWRCAMAQILESVLNLTRGILPGMKERQWGRIVNITSIAVKQPVDGLILSNSVRAAVTGFARTLANEVAPHGITVNNVLPGYTRTERLVELAGHLARTRGTDVREAYVQWEREIPMGRLGEPDELAALVAFLASPRAAYITGTSIAVDGGWTRSLL